MSSFTRVSCRSTLSLIGGTAADAAKHKTPGSVSLSGVLVSGGAWDRVSAEAPALTGTKGSLTITYFHTGIRTIIGVESFHGPVRDGKGWYQLAMVIRHNLLLWRLGRTANLGRSVERWARCNGWCSMGQ